MNISKRGLLLCASIISTSLVSHAVADEYFSQSDDWYLSVFGGASRLKDFDVHFTATNPLAGYSINEALTGAIVGIAVGKEVMPNVRAEAELSYWKSELDRMIFPITAYNATHFDLPTDGHVSSINLLANIWYDFDVIEGITPYLGGGAGIGFADAKSQRTALPAEFNGSDIGIAYQIGAGLKFALTDTVDFDFGYRYRGVSNVTFDSDYTAVNQINKSTDLSGHFLQFGLTMKFGDE